MVTLNPKMTGALAWLGLAVVIAVPSADYLAGGRASTLRVAAESEAPAAPAAVVPTRTGISVLPPLPAEAPAVATGPSGPRVVLPAPTGVPTQAVDRIETASTTPPPSGNNPVDTYLGTGRALPDYIRDDGTAATAPRAETPATTTIPIVPMPAITSPAEPARSEVAALAPAAPVPYPASRALRPNIANFPGVTSRPVESLVVEQPRASAPVRQARVEPQFPVPQAPVGGTQFPQAYPDGQIVGGEELQQWDSGSLADYLEQRRLLGPDAAAERTMRRPAPSYQQDYPAAPPAGFWLSDSPYANGGGYAY